MRWTLASRARFEVWDAHAPDTSSFTALRTRVGLEYGWGERLRAQLELQDARIHGLDGDSSGAAELYRIHAGDRSRTHGDRVRQLWIELRSAGGPALRLGRQDIKLGTEVSYPEPAWSYLKVQRASQRLVGTVGWTHAERSNDGVSLSWDRGAHHLYAFAARPTTGVFDLDSSYAGQEDIRYGGVSWTARRGAWLLDTELRLFALAYRDQRDASDGAFGGVPDEELTVYTVGASAIRVRPVGSGQLDALVWGALQWGDFQDLDHRAWAALVELGYRRPDAPGAPWLRAGVNAASGDRSPTDGDHESFFNLLPTNHLYYGFADRFALANLVDAFASLRLDLGARTQLLAFVHQLWLMTDDDGRHFGTGAFNKNSFGYGIQPSGGHRGVGTELDLVVSHRLGPRLTLEAGYAFLEGHAVLDVFSDDDVRFGYLEVTARY